MKKCPTCNSTRFKQHNRLNHKLCLRCGYRHEPIGEK